MPNSGGGKSKESVYITVEALGVQQASEQLKSVTTPLQQLSKDFSALPKTSKNLNLFTKQVSDSAKSTGKLKTQLAALSPVTKTMSSNFSALAKSGAQGIDAIDKLAGGAGLGKVKGVFEGLSVATTGLSAGMLAAGAAVAGVSLAVAATVKVGAKLIDAYKDINPEARTYKDIMSEAAQTVGDTNTAIMAMAGESLNDALNPALESVTQSFTAVTKEAANFLATLMSFDKTNKQSGFATMIQGTIGEIVVSTKKLFGMETKSEEAALQQLADGFYQTRVAGEQKLAENIKKKQEQRKQQAKQDARDVAKTIKDEFADIAKELSVYSLDLASGQIWDTKLLQGRDDLNVQHSAQLDALNGMSGNDEVKNKLRLQLEEEYQRQKRDLELRNAEETGNQEFLIAQRYMDMERQAIDAARQQRLDADIAASDAKWQHELDKYNAQQAIEEQGRQNQKQYLDGIIGTVGGTLTDTVSGMFDMISGDVEDVRGNLFDMFNSMAQNLFRTSLDAIVNSIIKMSMESGASAAQTPVIGPALAIAAVSGTMALGMAIAKRNQKQKPKIQYATGGYISEGLVRGAGGSGDSVEALLQPGERVLSKAETKEYDKGRNAPANITVNVTINGQLSTQSQIRDTVRGVLIPEIRSAVKQGYSLGVA